MRSLVCAEGTASLNLKDVHALITGGCKLLQEITQIFPDCKWIIVGGSPCQELTPAAAGSRKGLLGLTGQCSRLFFVLLCVIYSMQILVGATATRFFVENAGSLQIIHLEAFCKLLGLPLNNPGDHLWDPGVGGQLLSSCCCGQGLVVN